MNSYRTSGRPATITFLFAAVLLIGLLIPTTGVAAATRPATAPGTVSAALVASGATYHAISPTRLLDTRVANGLSGTFKSKTARTFQVTGRGGVPAGATAVTGNLTVTGQTQPGYLFIGPVATNSPSSSTLNFPKADDRANGVAVALSGSGTLSVTYVAASSTARTQAIFDVTGYFTADASGATYHAISPTRLLDTRVANGLSGTFKSKTARTFQVTGRGGVPAGATAVTGNLTVTGQTQPGYLFIGPVATNSPSSSTLNFPKADDRANGVAVALSGSGTLSVTYVAASSTARTQAIFDVTGYFTADASGATYHAISPTRLLDTRVANGLSGTFKSKTARTFQVTGRGGVPAGATAVTGNLTVTGQTQPGYLFIGPVATNSPSSSTLNFPKADDRANGVAVALSGSGTLSVTYVAASSTARTQAIFDVTGYFTSSTPAPTVTNVNPTSGTTAGGTSVTITGTNLSGATSVHFGATAGTINTNTATTITATSPAGAAATVDITVTTGGGTSATSSADHFTYIGPPPPVPTVTNVNPTSGTTAGGTSVTITGTNLSGATSVHFGATAGTINTNTATTITATSPAGAAATVDITVTTGGGTSATSSADHFTYTAPAGTITAVGTLQTDTVDFPALTTTETVSVSPAAVGNVLALAVEEKFPGGTPFTVSTVSGGGVTTWHRSNGGPTTDTQHGQELWWGTVTTAGASTITVTYSSVPGTANSAASLDVQEFHSSLGSWHDLGRRREWCRRHRRRDHDPELPDPHPDRQRSRPTSGISRSSVRSAPGRPPASSTNPTCAGTSARTTSTSPRRSPRQPRVSLSQTFFSIGMLLNGVLMLVIES